MQELVILLRDLGLGGVQRQYLELARVLGKRGKVKVTLLSACGGPLEKECQEAGISYQVYGRRGLFFFPCYLRWLARELKEKPLAVVCGTQLPENVAAFLLRLSGACTKVIFSFRNTGFHNSEAGCLLRFCARVETWIFRRTACPIMVNSYAGKEILLSRAIPEGLLYYVPNGVNPKRAEFSQSLRENFRTIHAIPHQASVLGYLGSGRPAKGLDMLIRVWEAFQEATLLRDEKTAPCLLCLAGPNEQEAAALLSLLKSRATRETVRFFPYQENIAEFLSALDVCVLPSHGGEGTPNVLLEAILCERLIIATQTGDTQRILGDWPGLIPAGDKEALLAAMEKLMLADGHHLRRELALLREKVLCEYAQEGFADNLESLLHSMTHDK